MVVDSSVWLEILRSGPLAAECERHLQRRKPKVPSVVLFEVYKKIRSKVSEDAALEATATLSQYPILEFNREIALQAADLSIEYSIGMADSIVLAHAHALNEPLITLDNDFTSISGVTVIR